MAQNHSQLRTFIKEGFYSLDETLENKYCTKLMNQIFSDKSYSSNMFLNEIEFNKNTNQFYKTNPGPGLCNLAEQYNLDFIFKNHNIVDILTRLLGKNYRTEIYKFVMGVPDSWVPEWIKKKILDFGGSNNLNPYMKKEYRDVTCYYGAEYHQDSIDYSGNKALKSKSFLIMYIYFEKVTLNDAPILVVPGSHLYGADTFPHSIIEEKNSIKYGPQNNKSVDLPLKVVTGETGTINLWHSLILHKTTIVKSKYPRISLKVIFEKTSDDGCIMDVVDNQIKGALLLDNPFDKSSNLFSVSKSSYIK